MHHRSTRIAAPAALAAALAVAAAPADANTSQITADVVHGTLVVSGTAAPDILALRVRSEARRTLELDAGDDGYADLEIKRSRFSRIVVRTGDGHDVIRIDDAEVAFTNGTPTALGDDVALLGAGDNRFVWDPGDGSDVVEGEDGLDELVFNGSGADERFDVSARGERVRIARDVGCIRIDLDGVERIATRALGGADSYTAGDLTGTDVNDLDADLAGAPGGTTGDGETLLGRSGDDFADGDGGDDSAVLGTGDDIARWEPGDGGDAIEGQAGHDVLLFLGSAADETFDISANGRRVRFLRDVGGIAMDLDGVEKTDTLAQGGADTIAVSDLTGTDLTHVETNLSGVAGLPAPDGAVDRMIVDGTAGDDAIAVAGAAGTVDLTGLPATVHATRAEGAVEQLVVDGGAGADTLDQSGLAAGTIGLTLSD